MSGAEWRTSDHSFSSASIITMLLPRTTCHTHCTCVAHALRMHCACAACIAPALHMCCYRVRTACYVTALLPGRGWARHRPRSSHDRTAWGGAEGWGGVGWVGWWWCGGGGGICSTHHHADLVVLRGRNLPQQRGRPGVRGWAAREGGGCASSHAPPLAR